MFTQASVAQSEQDNSETGGRHPHHHFDNEDHEHFHHGHRRRRQ